MDLTALINCSDTVEDVQLIESFFQLSDNEKDAAFYRKLSILYKGLEDDRNAENREIHPDLFNGWSVEEREAFERDWQDDPFVDCMPLDSQLPEPVQSQPMELPNQIKGNVSLGIARGCRNVKS